MIVGVAFCPHPPALIPELGRGLVTELGSLRISAVQAVRQIGQLSPDRVLLLGSGPRAARLSAAPTRMLNRYGVESEVGQRLPLADSATPTPTATPTATPLPIAVGLWLLEQAQITRLPIIAATAGPAGEIGDDVLSLARSKERVALIVLGDGSARRTERAPGYLDARAAGFDAGVLEALGSGDPAQLAHLDLDLAAELLAAGAPAWHAAATLLTAPTYRADVTYADDPFGVLYAVATWLR